MEQAFPAFGRVASSSCGVGRPVLGWVGGRVFQVGDVEGQGLAGVPTFPYSCAPLVTQQQCPSFMCWLFLQGIKGTGNGGSWSSTFPWHVVVGAPLLLPSSSGQISMESVGC